MDANKPAFVNSLVAMYGSSPESSDEEAEGPSASTSNTPEEGPQSVEGSPPPVSNNLGGPSKGDDKSTVMTDTTSDSPKAIGVTLPMSDKDAISVCPPQEGTMTDPTNPDEISPPDLKDPPVNENVNCSNSEEVVEKLAQTDPAASIENPSLSDNPQVQATDSAMVSTTESSSVSENNVDSISQPTVSERLEDEETVEENDSTAESLNKIGSDEHLDSNLENDQEPDDVNEMGSSSSQGPESAVAEAPARRLRQIRHPSAKAAEAAADAAFVAAATPTRKNLKEAKQASALAKVNESADASIVNKKSLNSRTRKGRSSSNDRSTIVDSRTSPLFFSAKEDSSSNDNSDTSEDKLTAVSEEMLSDVDSKEEADMQVNKSTVGKPVGIKLKFSKESVQILDPTLPKLEVQIPSESTSEFTCSPGGTKRLRKMKEGTLSPNPPLSPITLKIAKSKEGLEVISTENHPPSLDTEVGKVEKITLKLSRDEGATIVKPSAEELPEARPEKLTLKLVKDETSQKFTTVHSQEDGEDAKRGKLLLKLSKGEVKRKDADTASSSSENDGGKLERITLKRSTDNNVSIVRSKDLSQLERSASASPEPGKVEKITLKVSKNDNVSIVKPASPIPPAVGVEKLTLKMSKDGTAAVSSKPAEDLTRDGETSKLEKITLKLSKEDGVSIVKPASPIPDKKSLKMKDEPLSPLSPLIIARNEEVEPHKERITLKLSKAGGQPSPVGVIDERSSWSIKSTDSDTVPSPVPSDPTTPKSRPKRALADTPENAPSSAKRLKLSNMEKSDEPLPVTRGQNLQPENKEEEMNEECESMDDEKMDAVIPIKDEHETDPLADDNKSKVLNDETLAEESMDVILLDSEDSQNDAAVASETSIPVVDVENEVPTPRSSRRKPRGRPRKAVLTPGTVYHDAPAVSSAEDTVPTTPKPKRERVRPDPPESDRPKRSCKGREKPPPKPPKPVKPRGRAAAAKLKAEQSIIPEEPQLFEEETRMSADCGSQAEASTPAVSSVNSTNGLKFAKVVVSRLTNLDQLMASTPCETSADSQTPLITNEESQASQGSVSMVSSTTESTPNRGNRKGRMEINVDPDAQVEFTVDMIAEYLWPPNDGHGETYMIQEQISSYLGVKSFKRKYPNMGRRPVDHDERQYLLERKLVSESLCDLGLTALPSHEVLDVLVTDFPEKFEEYRRFTRERAQREFSNKQKALLASGATAKEDSKSKAMRNMASFNSMLNRNRKDQRRACFDLQSFTVHYPEQRRTKMTIPNLPRAGAYPLALVPGQYTDYYKEFTAAELRYFPLNTVLYGPLLPHELRMHSGGSDGSQSDSSESSSSDSSSSDSDSSNSDSDSDSDSSSDSEDELSSQVVQGALDSQEDEVERPDAVCRVCNGDRLKNKLGRAEPLVHCASCEKSGHLSCLDLTVDMMSHIRKYAWHCTDCKLCAQCNDTADEDKMLFCDMCDRGYHIYCVGLRKVPEGRWHCKECAVCASCAARDPGGTDVTQSQTSQDSPAKGDALQWQHEFKKGDKGTRIYVRTLCVPCSKLWKKGRFCRLCWKCFTNQPEEEGLINCSICDRWMHADCCRKAGQVIDIEKMSSYICELCQQKGVHVPALKSPGKVLR